MLSAIIGTQVKVKKFRIKRQIKLTKGANGQKQNREKNGKKRKKHTEAYWGQRTSISSLIDGTTVRI